MRRSMLLKYVSFLIMLVSLVRLFLGISMFNMFTVAKTMGAVDTDAVRLAAIALGLIILSAASELICGFIGALNWEEPLRAMVCVRYGTVSLLLGLAGNLTQSFTGYGVSWIAWMTGFVTPTLFLISALRFALSARRYNEKN